MEDLILEMRGITKQFPGVKALDNVNLKVERGEIHSLVGENGAGKSTLMNILSGVYTYGSFDGEIYFNDEICKFKNIKSSEEKGIAIIHQELALVPYLTIAENCFLGNERKKNGIIDWNKTITECQKALDRVKLKESPNTLVKNIGVGKQQLLEIAKALSKNVKLLILDEPTAALNENDSQHLLNLLLELKKTGVTSILISHKINEVSKVSDKITIIRDGQVIETLENKDNDISEDRIIKGMVGRTITNRFPVRETSTSDDVSLEVKDWNVFDENDSVRKAIDHVNFYARKGEVIGFAGLMGAGRTELVMSIFGKSWGKKISGQVFKDGKEVVINSVSDAIKNGIAYVTEDRKNMGLILINNILQNISLPNIKQFAKRNIINENEEIKVVQEYGKKLNIKSPSIFQCVGNLSGGNQQKVVLAKWILANPDVLILDEPTRGIDVGAKYEIYCIINKLVSEGRTIILISSELPEVLGMSDRIYVMNKGRIVGELEKSVATQENIMRCIMHSSVEE